MQSAQFSADATPDSTEAGPASDTVCLLFDLTLKMCSNMTLKHAQGSEDVNVTKHDAKDNGATPTESNAWSLSMYKKALDLNSANSGMTDFILLENLTARFKLPCVMDIKIGKRSYADDASPNKRVRSEEKSRSTTSHVLGFRLCGMQVYSQPNGRYLRADKYYGRELTPATVPDALSRFFSLNLDRPLRSCSHSRNLVHAIVDRLDALKDVLSTLSGLRFYSSSVLMVYEGDPSVRAPPESLVDLRIIDFANTTFGGRGDEATNGPDESFLFGLNTLATMLRDLTSESDDSDSHGGSD